ncbi:hypothetical protein HDU67_007656 [Dinochytrium kinnereticum]|nr:hypothetical protein HDU67_007656 [Dinochytrium kinnereticum]
MLRRQPLPLELVQDVMVYMDYHDALWTLARVCRAWRRISESLRWRHIYISSGSNLSNLLTAPPHARIRQLLQHTRTISYPRSFDIGSHSLIVYFFTLLPRLVDVQPLSGFTVRTRIDPTLFDELSFRPNFPLFIMTKEKYEKWMRELFVGPVPAFLKSVANSLSHITELEMNCEFPSPEVFEVLKGFPHLSKIKLPLFKPELLLAFLEIPYESLRYLELQVLLSEDQDSLEDLQHHAGCFQHLQEFHLLLSWPKRRQVMSLVHELAIYRLLALSGPSLETLTIIFGWRMTQDLLKQIHFLFPQIITLSLSYTMEKEPIEIINLRVSLTSSTFL